jgi:uncharacterized protein (DUF2126 family)
MAVEPRDGRLCVFMPPVEKIEDYLELIAAIEAARSRKICRSRSKAMRRRTPRINVIRTAPTRRDRGQHPPGVNLGRMRGDHRDLYEEARQTRLGADKFMIDGRHTGTGGGNHVVVGGQTPNDSPFLRRPDLLRSLILHWHGIRACPTCSGLFIGPTSQARASTRRGMTALRTGNGAGADPAPGQGEQPCPGWSTGCCATCWST